MNPYAFALGTIMSLVALGMTEEPVFGAVALVLWSFFGACWLPYRRNK